MSQYKTLAVILAAPALAALTLLSGCAGGDEKKAAAPAAAEGGAKPKPSGGKKIAQELAAPTDGVIKGRVVLDGPAPKIEENPAMVKHNDAKVCHSPDAPESEKIYQEWILASDKKGVANVAVKLLPPAGKKFKAMEPATKEVEMDQPHCAFVPHVVALTVGQSLKIKNSAPVAHNTKIQADPAANENASVTLQPGSDKIFKLNYQKNPVNVSCDFHPWMTGKVYVNDSPYIAVTDKEGNFEIHNVPTGEELTVVGMHEVGIVENREGLKRTFKAGDNAPLELKIKAQ
jgi:plastocyanin